MCVYKNLLYILGGGTSTSVFGFQTIPTFDLVEREWKYTKTEPDKFVIDFSNVSTFLFQIQLFQFRVIRETSISRKMSEGWIVVNETCQTVGSHEITSTVP